MKKEAIVLGVMVVFAIAFFAPVIPAAAEEESIQYDGWVGPDSALYGLKIAFENIYEAVSFSVDAKLAKQAINAEKRLAEAEAMMEKGKPEAAQKALERYMIKVAAINRTVCEDNCSETSLQNVQQRMYRHRITLQALIEDPKMPEEAKPALEMALNRSRVAEMVLSERVLKSQMMHAEDELAEIKRMVEAGDSEAVEEAMEMYMAKMREINETIERVSLSEKGLQHAQEMITRHKTVLQALIEDPKMPEEAKPALQRALNNSKIAENAIERAEEKMMRPESPPAEERPEVSPAKERPTEMHENVSEERPTEAPAEGRSEEVPAKGRPEEVPAGKVSEGGGKGDR
ncbi:MAG TPA: hypothetical protein ENI32_03460 [Candidatus Syntrophoarchaeum butanivorans]|nr:hypothetical protein [Candidatus Syntrophoarchaeum butanivorans]